MSRYIVTLFDREFQWYFEGVVEAATFEQARKQARRDYVTKTVRIVQINHE